MFISTKGRYALRVMIDLAGQPEDEYISLKDVAARQDISMKYLEMIVGLLNKGGLLLSQRGKTGGYKLAKKASECTIREILGTTEGSLAPVQCLNGDENVCERAGDCITLPLWIKLDSVMNDYLEGVTLENLINGKV